MVDSLPAIPDFSLLRRIGRGSYGDVWLARSVTGVYRAVKVVYRSRFDEERPYEREFAGIRKFEPISVGQDTQVSLFHVGRNDAAGFFYYVLELADDVESGEEILPEKYVPKTLKEMRARQSRLPAEECVGIGVALARALEHLHRHGLVHRDIKPSNVIFVHGVPKLADIGLISAVDTSASFVGTEGFVPPEGPGSVQADLYSLGKVLYEISTGRDRQDFPKLPDDIDTLPDARALLELNEVMLKACDSDLQRRYSSAQAMHDDLVLLQAGKSVKRLHLIERRFRIAAKYGIAATILTVATAGAFLWASSQARKAKESFALSEQHRTRAELALWESQLNQARAQRMTAIAGRRFDTLQLLRKAAAATNRLELRNQAIACLALPDLRPAKQWRRSLQGDSWQFDSQLQRYFTNDSSGNVRIRDVETDRELAWLPGEGASLTRMLCSPDDRFMATSDTNGKARVWELEGRKAVSINCPKSARLLCFSPGGRSLVLKHTDRSLRFVNSVSGRDEMVLAGPFPGSLVFNFAGDAFCTVSGTQVVVYATATGATLTTLDHPDIVMSAGWHPDGRRLVTGSGNDIYFWDTAAGRQVAVAQGHEGRVVDLIFDKTGELLVSGSWDGTTRFWHADSHHELVRGPDCGNMLRISPDARRLSFKSWDHSRVELWEVANGREVRRFQVPNYYRQSYHAGFSPNGKLLHIVNPDGVYLFDIASGQSLERVPATHSSAAAFHPSGTHFITCGLEGLRRWPIRIDDGVDRLHFGPSEGLELSNASRVNTFSLTPDGRRLVAIADDGFRVLNPLGEDDVVRSTPAGSRPTSVPVISPDGRWVAMGKRGNRLQIADARSGKVVTNLNVGGSCRSFFSPDNRWLLSATFAEYRYWEVGSWKLALRIPRAPTYSNGNTAAFTPDGELVALSMAEQSVRLFVAGTERELATLPAARLITHVCFSPDGSQLLITSENGVAQLWDLRLIRKQLADMNLDWDEPSFAPPGKDSMRKYSNYPTNAVAVTTHKL